MPKIHKKQKTIFVSIFFLMGLLIFVGCGKKGDPNPPITTDFFSVTELTARLTNDCLVFTGSLQGAQDMLDKFRLEMSFLDGGVNDCPSCPFVPEEIIFISSDQIHLDKDSGAFSFTYCSEQKAQGYRWQVYGLSKLSNIPVSQSPVHLIKK